MSNHHLQPPDHVDQKPDRPLSFSMFTWYTDTLPELEEPPRVRPNSSPVTSSPPPLNYHSNAAPPQNEQMTTPSYAAAIQSEQMTAPPQNEQMTTSEVPAKTEEEPATQVIMRHESQYREEAYDYLCFSMFNMLLCCFPLGIIAITMSLDVRARNAGEDYAGAHKMSKSAKQWNYSALIAGIIQYIIAILTTVLFFYVGQTGSKTVKMGISGGAIGGGGGWGDNEDSWMP